MQRNRLSLFLIIFCTFLGTAAQIFMKRGMTNGFFDWETLLGSGLLILAGIVFMFSLKWGKLSSLHPMLSLGFVWVTISAWIMGESITITRSLGITSVIIGSALLSWRAQ
ncbi:hypothetical protein GOV11_05435 [Candidatus Woesearchaeota archaeon]|nr:hypothetical protein [Candidatus Woesearchaeota archaeon]